MIVGKVAIDATACDESIVLAETENPFEAVPPG